MRRMIVAFLTAGMAVGAAAPASANDGHGNAKNPALSVPNTGDLSGGPTHRDDPRVRESQERRADGRPAHGPNDGHRHGHN